MPVAVAVCEARHPSRSAIRAEGAQPGSPLCRIGSRLSQDLLLTLRRVLGKSRAEQADQRYIQPVEPNNSFLTGMTVLVPFEVRRKNQIPGFHMKAFAAYRGERAVPFEDETEC